MNLPRLVLKSLRQHALSTGVTVLGVALAGGLVLSVWVLRDQAEQAFAGMTGGADAVLGARGSKLQLVLNAVFHLDESPGNIPWADVEEIRRHPSVDVAVPMAGGDNYRGYRVVGTTPELFERLEYAPGRKLAVRAPGRQFDPTAREAVVGSFVARRLGLKRGDEIHPYHGLVFDEDHQHDEDYVVVGVLEPSNTPADRVIWIPLEGIQRMSRHDPRAANEVSAVLVRFKAGSPLIGRQLETQYNREGSRLTFAWPIARIVAQLFERLAWFDRVLGLVAYVVAVLAAAAILASIYNSMNERKRELAILRALGARRRTLFGAVVLEAAAIAALGMIAGFAVHGGISALATAVLREQTGVVLEVWTWHPVLVTAPLGMILLGALVGLVPAWKAYRTDVAENLAPHS